MHDNGRTATVTFLDNAYLEAHRDYTFVIDIPGYASAESTHQRPEYLEDARIVGYNDNGTVVVRGYHPTSDSERVAVQENLNLGDVNLEGVLGQSGVFAYLRNNTVENFYQNDSETTVLGAVTDVNYNTAGTTPVSIEMSNGETYRLASGFIPRYNGTVDQSLTTTGDAADYAKVTLNSNNQVVFYDAYDWNRQSLIVESVDGNIVSGFGDQFNLTDYTVVESGEEIGISDISQGDNIYFNTTVEYAEVYNELAVGMIDRIFEDRVIVEGNEYQLTSDSAFIDAEGNRQSLQATHLQQFVDSEEPVSLYLDRSGNVSFVLGDLGDFVVGEDAAYLTSTVNAYRQGQRSNIELNYRSVTGSSESVTLGLEQLTRINDHVKGRPFIDGDEELAVIDYFTFDENAPGEGNIVAVLRGDSPNQVVVSDVEDLGNKDIIDFVKNNDGDIVGFNTLISGTYSEASLQDAAEVGASYLEGVTTDGVDADIRVFGSTPVFLHDEDDNFVGVASWDEVEAFDFDLVTGATVYHGNNNPAGIADYLVINVDEDTDLDTETVETNAVVNSVSYNAAGDEITQISLIVDGQFVTYEVNLSDEQNAALTGADDRLVRGEAVDVEVNSNDVVIGLEELGETEVGTVSSVSTVDRTVTLTDGGTYRFDQNTYIVDNRSGNTPEFLTLTDLENLDDVNVLVYTVSSGTNFVDFIVVNSGSPAPTPTITANTNVEGTIVELTANFAHFTDVDSDNVTVAFELEGEEADASFVSEEDADYTEGVYTESFALIDGFEDGNHEFDVTVSYDGIDSEEFSFTITVEDEATLDNN
ncbi:hypothetical protein DH09_10150 [Bacillaceae bacterium JMAK1]|nr:hypothetical protein DH09_10150 [Bacillaceae bacterium JMAK1]